MIPVSSLEPMSSSRTYLARERRGDHNVSFLIPSKVCRGHVHIDDRDAVADVKLQSCLHTCWRSHNMVKIVCDSICTRH